MKSHAFNQKVSVHVGGGLMVIYILGRYNPELDVYEKDSAKR